MGDATSEPSDRLHFLRLQHVGLKPPSLGDIPGNTLNGCRLPHLKNETRADFESNAGALLGDDFQFEGGLGSPPIFRAVISRAMARHSGAMSASMFFPRASSR